MERVVAPTAAPDHAPPARSGTTRVGLRITRIRAIPIPTPLPHVPRHVIQPIPVCPKVPHRAGVGINPIVEGRMITPRRADVEGVGRGTEIVRPAVRYRVHIRPRKPMPACPPRPPSSPSPSVGSRYPLALQFTQGFVTCPLLYTTAIFASA